MKVLFVGGTGEISQPCVEESVRLGHQVTVCNRGLTNESLPRIARRVVGALDSEQYRQLARESFDCVCQFAGYQVETIERDIELWTGRTAQYLFISSASAYRKNTARFEILTETTPLANPYWDYSQAKIAMEQRLLAAHRAGQLPVTIVRPSHTYRRKFPTAIGGGYWTARRMLAGLPVIVHGDGSSLWTLTHAEDFARPFAQLLGNDRAIGEAFHLTGAGVHTWDEIFLAIGRALGVCPRLVHVPSDRLLQFEPLWRGKLLGDKTPSTLFDNSKVAGVAGAYPTEVGLDDGLARAAPFVLEQLERGAGHDKDLDALVTAVLQPLHCP